MKSELSLDETLLCEICQKDGIWGENDNVRPDAAAITVLSVVCVKNHG